ncbi:MAG: ATP-binding cassette domain-containing protein [Dehalococcoidia bacterium]
MTALNVQQLALRARGLPDEAISFTVADGQVAALFGRPGSGVRGVMRAIAGLDAAAGGEVRVGDTPVHNLPPNKRHVGLVQRDSVLFNGSVRENIEFGLKRAGWPKGDRSRRVAEVLELVGMTGAEGDPTDTLTEGERARVILARAIAPKPAALLVESPTWFVPDVDRIAFRGRLREVFQSLEIPVLISTNDVQDAVGIADDLHVMHDGRLLQSGSVSRVLAGPSSIDAAELVGYVTLIRGEVSEGWIIEPGAGAVQFPVGFPLQGRARALSHPAVMLGVPESSGLGCGVAGTVERVRAIGPTYLLDLRIGERTVEVRWEWDLNPPDAQEVIAVAVPPGTLRFFNEPNAPRPAGAGETGDRPDRAERADRDSRPETARAAAVAGSESAHEPVDLLADDAEEDPPVTVWTSSSAAAELAEPPRTDAEGLGAPAPSRPRVEVQEFTPSDGLMAEPPPPRAEPQAITYTPLDVSERDAAFLDGWSDSSGAPAPAPPRTRAPEPPPRSEPEAPRDDVELMAPWLQVSRPAREPEETPKPPDPHRGMPLD